MNTKNLFQSKYLVYLAVITASIAIAWGMAFHWSRHAFFLNNGDVVGDVFIVHDFIYNHDHIRNWVLTNAFFLFPDMVLIFLISLFVPNISSVFPAYALMQICLTGVFIIILMKQLIETKKTAFRLGLLTIFSLILLVLALNPFYEYGSFDYLVPILLPSFHFGSFLICIISIALTIKLLKRTSLIDLITLSLLTVLTGISDPLYLYYFTIPAMATIGCWAMLRQISLKQCCNLLLWFAGMTLVWFVIYEFFPLPFYKIPLHLTFPLFHLKAFYKSILFFLEINLNIPVGIAWLVFVLVAPISLFYSFKSNNIKLYDFLLLFLYLMLIISLLAILTTVIDFNKAQQHIPLRYLISFVLGPIFLGLPVLIYKHFLKDRWLENNWVYITLLIVVCFASLHHLRPIEWGQLVSYYPKNVQCFDKTVVQYNLHNGITADWDYQNTYNAFNRSNTHLILLNMVTLKPHLWFSTKHLYQNHDFDYVLLSPTLKTEFKQNKSAMMHHFGQPTATVACHGVGMYQTQYIYIYKNNPLNKLSFEKFY